MFNQEVVMVIESVMFNQNGVMFNQEVVTLTVISDIGDIGDIDNKVIRCGSFDLASIKSELIN